MANEELIKKVNEGWGELWRTFSEFTAAMCNCSLARHRLIESLDEQEQEVRDAGK